MHKFKYYFFFCVVVMILLLPFGTAFADLNMTFEDGIGSWERTSGSGTMTTEYIDSTPCLTVDSPSESTVYKMTLPEKIAASGTYVLSYDIIIPKINTGSGKQTFVVEGHSTNGSNSFYGLMIDNGGVYYYNGSEQYDLSSANKNGETDTILTLKDNTWHNLKTIYNRDKDKFTYFVDNIPVLDSKGNILKVDPYSSVKDYEIDSLVIRAINDSDDKKIYVKNISLCKLDSDITQGAMYNSFAGGVAEFTLRKGTTTDKLEAKKIDDEHGKSMRLSTAGTTAYHELMLTDKPNVDNDIYELGYEIYFEPYTATGKQMVSVVGLDGNKTNTFYGLRLENSADGVSVLYYNGEGQYDTSTGYTRDGNQLLISHDTWHKIKTVWDRASSMFTYYIDSVPVYTAKGDIARPHVRSSEIDKKIYRITIQSNNTKDIPVYIDNLYLTRTEKLPNAQGVSIYNAAFVDDNDSALNPDNMANVTNFKVKFDYDAAENFTPIIAFYDGDTLKDVAQYSVDVSKDGYTTGKVLQATNIYGAPNVKFFVWDGFKNLVPYKVYTKAQNKEISQKLNVTTVSDEYFTMWGDSLTIVSKTNGKSVVLKAPVISPTIKEDGTAKGPETRYYINFTVNDKSYHNRKDGIVYELVVKYFDEGYGVFTLEYDTIYESLVEAEYIELGNTKTWKTHTFVLKNPCFTGEGVDFRLCTWGEKMRYSNYDVPFGRVTLRSRGTRDQFIIKSVGDNIGNIYYTGDTATFTTTISNRDFYEYSNTFGEYNATVKYTLLDVNKNPIKVLGEKTVTIFPTSINEVKPSINFKMETYGLYFLKTEVINHKFELLGENITELSYVHSDKKTVNYDYGTSIQTGLYPISSDDPKTTTNGSHNLAKYAGIGMLRYVRGMGDAMKITYGSSGSKLSQGTYDADWGKYDSLMKSNGYILLNNLLATSMIYSDEVDSKGRKFTVPHGDTGLDYFAQYCTFFAKEYRAKYPDETRYYEIWNEFDSPPGSKYNYNGDDWDYYGNIIVAAADAIYAVDPDAEIVALSSRFVKSHERAIIRVKELIDAGKAYHSLDKYFTNVSIHPYYRNDNPMNLEVHSESYTENATNLYEHMEILRKIYDKYGLTDTKLWISEIAWSPGYINFDRKQAKAITEKQQGSYLVQTYVMTRKNTDKYLPYLFSRNVNVRVDSDDNMGIIKNKDPNLEDVPYAATSAYLATANLNMLITKATYEEDFFFDDTERSSAAYRFTKADGKDLAILWSIYEEGEDVSINLGAESVTMYDEYGNTTPLTSEDGIYNLNLTQSTVYLEGDFTAFAKE